MSFARRTTRLAAMLTLLASSLAAGTVVIDNTTQRTWYLTAYPHALSAFPVRDFPLEIPAGRTEIRLDYACSDRLVLASRQGAGGYECVVKLTSRADAGSPGGHASFLGAFAPYVRSHFALADGATRLVIRNDPHATDDTVDAAPAAGAGVETKEPPSVTGCDHLDTEQDGERIDAYPWYEETKADRPDAAGAGIPGPLAGGPGAGLAAPAGSAAAVTLAETRADLRAGVPVAATGESKLGALGGCGTVPDDGGAGPDPGDSKAGAAGAAGGAAETPARPAPKGYTVRFFCRQAEDRALRAFEGYRRISRLPAGPEDDSHARAFRRNVQNDFRDAGDWVARAIGAIEREQQQPGAGSPSPGELRSMFQSMELIERALKAIKPETGFGKS